MVSDGIIITLEDRNAWRNYLMELPKETLIEYLLDTMCENPDFGEKTFFSLVPAAGTVETVMAEFRHEVQNELRRDDARTERFLLLGKRVSDYAAHLDNDAERLWIHLEIADILEDAVYNGAGYTDEMDYLIWEFIDELRNDA